MVKTVCHLLLQEINRYHFESVDSNTGNVLCNNVSVISFTIWCYVRHILYDGCVQFPASRRAHF